MIVLTKKEHSAIASALGFALAGEFEEVFGDDAEFTQDDVKDAQHKIASLRNSPAKHIKAEETE